MVLRHHQANLQATSCRAVRLQTVLYLGLVAMQFNLGCTRLYVRRVGFDWGGACQGALSSSCVFLKRKHAALHNIKFFPYTVNCADLHQLAGAI